MLEDELVLFAGPLAPHDVRIDHVVPALAALPAEAVGKVPGDDYPILRAEQFDLLAEYLILVLRPGRAILNLLRYVCLVARGR